MYYLFSILLGIFFCSLHGTSLVSVSLYASSYLFSVLPDIYCSDANAQAKYICPYFRSIFSHIHCFGSWHNVEYMLIFSVSLWIRIYAHILGVSLNPSRQTSVQSPLYNMRLLKCLDLLLAAVGVHVLCVLVLPDRLVFLQSPLYNKRLLKYFKCSCCPCLLLFKTGYCVSATASIKQEVAAVL